MLLVPAAARAQVPFGPLQFVHADSLPDPTSAAAGDIDGDGDLDVAACSSYSDSVAWFSNDDGLGGAWTQRPVDDDYDCRDLDVADLDGDGDLDLVVIRSGGASWFENLGVGGSWTEATLVPGSNGSAVEAVDVDGDGDLDLATMSYTEGARWAENVDGDASLWISTEIDATFTWGDQILALDLDGDGGLDLAGHSTSLDELRWFSNDLGDGSVWSSGPVDQSSGLNVRQIDTADVDGDGDADLLGADMGPDQFVWWENVDGVGATWARSLIRSSLSTPSSVRAADLDDDGDQDVAIGCLTNTYPRWMENVASDGSSWSHHYIDTGNFHPVYGLLTADIDGDATPDLLAVEQSDHRLEWWGNTAGNGLVWSSGTILEGLGTTTCLAVGDIDGDGDDDLAGCGSRSVDWFENTDGLGGAWTHHHVDTNWSPRTVHLADLDGDGDLDLVASSSGLWEVAWWENVDGDGATWDRTTVGLYFNSSSTRLFDLDADGDLDIVGLSDSDDLLSWWQNTSGDASTWVRADIGTVSASSPSFDVGDVDGDGDGDLLVGLYGLDSVEVWINTSGDASTWSTLTVGAHDDVRAVALADLDDDGDLDAASVGYSSTDGVLWWDNVNGDASSWTPSTIDSATRYLDSVRALDLDGDGDLDLVSTDYVRDDLLQWANLSGDASSWSAAATITEELDNPGDVVQADLDLDGWMDLVLTGPVDGEVAWARALGDADGDGEPWDIDCDDQDPAINSLAVELCNGVDDDCDGVIDDGFDSDGDGWTTCAGDCDDSRGTVWPGAVEICDGLDNDCDGSIPSSEFDLDADGYRPCGGDCDDLDATAWPLAPEVCDGDDEDCDGLTDDGFDGDGDGWTSCGGDCDDSSASVRPGAAEGCDGLDTDCDGTIPAIEVDADGDTYGICEGDCDDFDPTAWPLAPEVCDGDDEDCDGVVDDGFDVDGDGWTSCGGDCDDSSASVRPGAAEGCDGLDTDCDGTIPADEIDTDGDSYGVCEGDCDDFDATAHPLAAEVCDGDDEDCDGLVDDGFDVDGDGWTTCAGDCADTSPSIHPGATETADDGVDQDCDGNDSVTCFADLDFDGVGGPSTTVSGDGDCSDPGESTSDDDCNDSVPSVHPGATELCDAIDQDCDGELVEGFSDLDGDGLPDCVDADDDGDGDHDDTDCDDDDPTVYTGAVEACDDVDSDCDGSLVDGFSNHDGDPEPDCVDLDDDGDGFADTGDCDPLDDTVYSGAAEVADDGIDQNCNGFDTVTCWEDGDGDGFGDLDAPRTFPLGYCDSDDLYVQDSTDCDDDDPLTWPGAPELCDELDNDCDGSPEGPGDEPDFVDWWFDADGDGFGDPDVPWWETACSSPDDGYVAASLGADCDDADDDRYPGADELCDGLDTDCDGVLPDDEADTDGDGEMACAGDCADEDADRLPGVGEVCDDRVDNDCDGLVDGNDPLCLATSCTGCDSSATPGGAPALLLLLVGVAAARRRRSAT